MAAALLRGLLVCVVSATLAAGGSVLVLNDPRSMDAANRANVLRAVREMTPAPTVVDAEFVKGGLAQLIAGASAVVIAGQENCYMDLSAADRTALSSFVHGGGLMVRICCCMFLVYFPEF
jgi:hypothetical protein